MAGAEHVSKGQGSHLPLTVLVELLTEAVKAILFVVTIDDRESETRNSDWDLNP